ncbi:D-alanyl-D-alanine carboxypeptidase family protein [Streptomyces purpureus]|uniref:D-alanyl-D-alanine carboxypeptidase n=1 Tax=Streptomyces purpureus TaxID=1951 RepID=A0A918LNV6_9ACTN|nr:serine hydrolase [Streptomyces purpureus]GGT29432.1 D-alanyl-D-alanine carboxypeptidase [Streptomyces purpureus]
MFVMSAVRHTAGAAVALLLLLSPSPAAAATVDEPTPPSRARYDPARLYGSGTQVNALPDGPGEPPEVSARSWLVADAGSGDVLAAHDAHRRLPPASTLKALFAVTALPGLAPSKQHRVSEKELEDIGPGSSLVGVRAGYTYRVSDLWNGVFLSSGNDAVRVLAAMSGGWEATVRRMQEKAKALGAHDTRVVSPDGYDAPGQVSSAYDLALFGREGLRNPDFVRYAGTAYARFPSGGWSYGIKNTNRLLTGADGVDRYPGLIGVKNGYTSGAGSTLIAAARRKGRTLVVTVMNPRWGGYRTVYEEARELLDWGFEAAGRIRPVGTLAPAPPRPAKATEAAKAAKAVNASAAPTPPVTATAGRAEALAPSPTTLSGTQVVAGPDSSPDAGPSVSLVSAACAGGALLWLARRRGTRGGWGG